MLIREATDDDIWDIFQWRNDPISRAMFVNQEPVSYDEHEKWFKETQASLERKIFLSVDGVNKIGVCHFKLKYDEGVAEISVNLNPAARGRGFSQKCIYMSCIAFQSHFALPINAIIKHGNLASERGFIGAGFEKIGTDTSFTQYRLYPQKIRFEKVTSCQKHIELLYLQLKDRPFSISHSTMPSWEEHSRFIRNHPYRDWYLIAFNNYYVGNFYIQEDNSIGLQLPNIGVVTLNEVLAFVKANHQPSKPVKSIVPEYFFVNAAYTNTGLIDALKSCGASPIQISFRVS